jgi:hypothetical protein
MMRGQAPKGAREVFAKKMLAVVHRRRLAESQMPAAALPQRTFFHQRFTTFTACGPLSP